MSEVINVTDKFLKCKLKMNSENEQFWNRILFMVTQFIHCDTIATQYYHLLITVNMLTLATQKCVWS